jgi:hypothetical protein
METIMDDLSTELNTYRTKLPTLLGQQGKFVLIKGDAIDGVYNTYAEAMTAGYSKHGLDKPFFVRKISPIEQVSFFSRDLGAACQA